MRRDSFLPLKGAPQDWHFALRGGLTILVYHTWIVLSTILSPVFSAVSSIKRYKGELRIEVRTLVATEVNGERSDEPLTELPDQR